MSDSTRISTRLQPWVDAAVEKHAQGDSIVWEFGLGPGPQGQPMVSIVLWLPGAVMDTAINGIINISNPMQVTEENIDQIIGGTLEQLRAQRSQQLGAVPAGLNGHRPSGLILPG